MKILFTGASSFTGFWFVGALAKAGHEVTCPVTTELGRYTGVRQQRMKQLQSRCRVVENTPFGTATFLELARSQKFDLLCHHAADVTNYKSADFDAVNALKNNTLGLREVLKTLACPVLLTGSVFENDEGKGTAPLRAFSPYGLSKALTFQSFRYYCQEAGTPLGKFVIPNPFGPMEEPRFTSYLLKTWKDGKVAQVKTPRYLRDNIHVDLLALAYVSQAAVISGLKSGLVIHNPSGYVESQRDFASRVAREVRARLGWECGLDFPQQVDFSEPLERVNLEPAAPSHPSWNEANAWDGFVEFYRQTLA